MPWAGKLYVQNYNSHKARSGAGVSLRVIHEDLSMEVVPETRGVDGTYTNRFVHFASNQMIIGPHVIDERHRIRTVSEFVPLRVCGTIFATGWDQASAIMKVFTAACSTSSLPGRTATASGEFARSARTCGCSATSAATAGCS